MTLPAIGRPSGSQAARGANTKDSSAACNGEGKAITKRPAAPLVLSKFAKVFKVPKKPAACDLDASGAAQRKTGAVVRSVGMQRKRGRPRKHRLEEEHAKAVTKKLDVSQRPGTSVASVKPAQFFKKPAASSDVAPTAEQQIVSSDHAGKAAENTNATNSKGQRTKIALVANVCVPTKRKYRKRAKDTECVGGIRFQKTPGRPTVAIKSAAYNVVVDKIREILSSKSKAELRLICESRGLSVGESKIDRIETLIEHARNAGEIDREFAACEHEARREELLAMDTAGLRKLCESLEVDYLVKEVMIDRILSCEEEG